MDTIKAFFPKIRAVFSIFMKGPPLPPSCAAVSLLLSQMTFLCNALA